MKKLLIYSVILSQFVAVTLSWGMGKKMENGRANSGQAEESAASKLETQDRDSMNQTTGFSGQTNSEMDLETDGDAIASDQESLDLKSQSNLPGKTGQTSSGPVTTGQGINSDQFGTSGQTSLMGQEKNSVNTQSTKSTDFTNPTGKSTTSNSY